MFNLSKNSKTKKESLSHTLKGNPHVDAKVEKAKNNPDKDGPAYRQSVFDKVKKARR